ncbi:Las1-like protein, partial [Tothia fuscella]
IRPWRDLAELLEVRHLLYPSNEAEHDVRYDSQRLGVNMVNTWKRRCRVPHSIYSTAVLVDAELHHNVEKNSTFAIRVVYSTAFARFVTGFCDIGQNSIVKRSMFEMAELIGMPEAWVELRHEITHGQVPDLRTLEHYVQASLVWLWDFFWIKLDAPHTD